MRDLLVDGMMSGTGTRDAIAGGYLDPKQLALPSQLQSRLATWLSKYAGLKASGYADKRVIVALDNEGQALAAELALALPEDRVGYYSDALMKRLG